MPEVMVLFFAFQTLSTGTSSGAVSIPPGATWDEAANALIRHSVQEALTDLGDLYLPASIFTSIFAAVTISREFESGQLKLLLSHPVSRAAVFWAKAACISAVTFAALVLSLALGVMAPHMGSLGRLVEPGAFWHLILGVFLASAVLATGITGTALFAATASKNTAITLAVAISLFLGLSLAGIASRSPYLPPLSLSRPDGLLYPATDLPPELPIFIPIVVTYAVVGIIAAFAAYHVFRRAEIA